MRDLWEKGKLLWARFSEVSVGTYASSISYFAFLSNAVIVVILPDDVDDFLEVCRWYPDQPSSHPCAA